MTDPFTLLGVAKAADKRQILSRVAVAMRERRYNAKQIAEAQKELFDPVARAAAEFSHFIDVQGCIGDFAPAAAAATAVPELELLDAFDEKRTAQR